LGSRSDDTIIGSVYVKNEEIDKLKEVCMKINQKHGKIYQYIIIVS
jgi:hypothetical protein